MHLYISFDWWWQTEIRKKLTKMGNCIEKLPKLEVIWVAQPVYYPSGQDISFCFGINIV